MVLENFSITIQDSGRNINGLATRSKWSADFPIMIRIQVSEYKIIDPLYEKVFIYYETEKGYFSYPVRESELDLWQAFGKQLTKERPLV